MRIWMILLMVLMTIFSAFRPRNAMTKQLGWFTASRALDVNVHILETMMVSTSTVAVAAAEAVPD